MRNINDFADFLKERVNLNHARMDTLDQKMATITGLLKGKLVSYQKYEKQGSYALGTMIKPVRDDDEVDADLLIYMDEKVGWGARDYIDAIHDVLRKDANYRDIVRRKTRCVTIDYRGDFHVDLVPAIDKPDGVYICNYDENRFEQTDGTGFRDWVNGKTKSTNGELKRVTRLMKFLRDHKDNFSIKSILLTTLLGNSVSPSDSFEDTGTALVTILRRLNEFLEANPRMPSVVNPALPSEEFNRHWDQSHYENFRQKISAYLGRALDAYNEEDRNESIRKWRKLFGDHFGTIRIDGHSNERLVVPRKPYARS